MSLSISVVLFDVDGTLVDSAPAVMSAFRDALSDYDLPIPDDQRLRTYVGPPLWYSFADLGYEGELLAGLVTRYRTRYQAHYLDPEPFPGVIDLLHDLHNAGIPLATATSKQTPMAVAQMEQLGLTSIFDVVAGATPDPSSNKARVIREALRRWELISPTPSSWETPSGMSVAHRRLASQWLESAGDMRQRMASTMRTPCARRSKTCVHSSSMG